MFYDMPLYRPPSEGRNLIIQATLGCKFNQCSFCSMYRSKRYTERPLEEIFADVRQAARAWPQARRVFLADGNALALPAETLLAILRELHAALPRLERVSCYATPNDVRRKSETELEQLRAHRLDLLYMGIESGADRVLKKITKGATQRGIGLALAKARQCGLAVSGTVILGLGGRAHWQEHVDGTLELLNSAPVTYLSTLQIHLDDSVATEFLAKFKEPFEMPDDLDMLREQERLVRGIDPPAPVVFRSNHASNALALAGDLPADRERLLAQVRSAMDGSGPLRALFMRGL